MQKQPDKPDMLEDFVKSHRADMDTDFPSEALWERISHELDKAADLQPDGQKRIFKMPLFPRLPGSVFQLAAAVVVLAAAWVAIRFSTPVNENAKATQTAQAAQIDINKLSPELAQADAYYTKVIETKQQQLHAYTASHPEMRKAFTQDLNGLDSAYTSLKIDLSTTPKKEQVVSAMIDNLRLRIEILNRQLKILQKIERKQHLTPSGHEPQTHI